MVSLYYTKNPLGYVWTVYAGVSRSCPMSYGCVRATHDDLTSYTHLHLFREVHVLLEDASGPCAFPVHVYHISKNCSLLWRHCKPLPHQRQPHPSIMDPRVPPAHTRRPSSEGSGITRS